MVSPFETAGVFEVGVIQRLAGWEPRGPDNGLRQSPIDPWYRIPFCSSIQRLRRLMPCGCRLCAGARGSQLEMRNHG
jgi:hypothetical protein